MDDGEYYPSQASLYALLGKTCEASKPSPSTTVPPFPGIGIQPPPPPPPPPPLPLGQPPPPPPPGSPPRETPSMSSFVETQQASHGAQVVGSQTLLALMWRRCVGRQASALVSRLLAANVPSGQHICAICQRLPAEGLAAHIAEDPRHIAEVQALLDAEGPEGARWTQTWPRVARFHHLNLDIVEDDTPLTPPTPLPTATRSVEQIPSASACGGSDMWEEYQDQESGQPWWHNTRTGEASWSPRGGSSAVLPVQPASQTPEVEL